MKAELERATSEATRGRYALRPMQHDDIPVVQAIERDSFPSAWPQTAYERELRRNRMARYIVLVDQDAPPYVAQTPAPAGWLERLLGRRRQRKPSPPADGEIVGFVGIWLLVDEAHIVTIAVRPDRRQERLGELLLCATVDLARAARASAVTLEVRLSNAVAQNLYEKYGFLKVGRRPRYYSDNHEDALIMTTEPIDAEPWSGRYAALREQVLARFGLDDTEGASAEG
jgi:ribosomal-protein-alanine N-acetyltransferase